MQPNLTNGRGSPLSTRTHDIQPHPRLLTRTRNIKPATRDHLSNSNQPDIPPVWFVIDGNYSRL